MYTTVPCSYLVTYTWGSASSLQILKLIFFGKISDLVIDKNILTGIFFGLVNNVKNCNCGALFQNLVHVTLYVARMGEGRGV
jgi:hypothetical protein